METQEAVNKQHKPPTEFGATFVFHSIDELHNYIRITVGIYQYKCFS